MRRILGVALAVLVAVGAVSLSAGKPTPVRVYVFPAAQASDRWPNPDRLRDRRDSAEDLKDRLPAGRIWAKRIDCVSKEKANVWLEVLHREDHVGLIVRLTIPGTDYSVEWTADSPTWGGAAQDIVRRFDGWLEGNLERLPK